MSEKKDLDTLMGYLGESGGGEAVREFWKILAARFSQSVRVEVAILEN